MFGSLLRQKPSVRSARANDAGDIALIARHTLFMFGRYDELLPAWMKREGISTFISELKAEPTGLCMLGFFEDPERGFYADLLAIAVLPTHQGTGVGRQLVRFAIAESRRQLRSAVELRLSVADTNDRARALFASEGFEPRPYELGTYDGGQVALRMAYPLCPPAATRAA